jgi:hypothetical protein
MPNRLLVASGGGGDAIAAVLIAQATEPVGAELHIATFSWDRLIVDPVPGPREPSDFVGLKPVARWNYQVTATTAARPPAGSTLPRLAAELPATFYLLDPGKGAVGLRRQLRELAGLLSVDFAEIVDVGGDILAAGDEPSLRSPLADSLTLAGLDDLGVSTDVLIAGPGLDGELPESDVLARCSAAAQIDPTLLTHDAARAHGHVFDWHLSEATGLFRAAALGVRGRAELRDHGAPVALTDHSPEMWRLALPQVMSINRIAQALLDTESLADAEAALLGLGRHSEIDYERTKAEWLATLAPNELHTSLSHRLRSIEDAAATRGADFITVRRLTELLQLRGEAISQLASELRQRSSARYLAPLWAVHPSAERLLSHAR